jgi:Kdo2-lipid IVA lauroyltransferase/acyltransferase
LANLGIISSANYTIAKRCTELDSYLIYILARLVIFLFRVLPRRLGACIIRFLGACMYYLDSRHRHIAAVNLSIAFPDLTERERTRIARRSFQNTGMNLLEVSRLPSLTPNNISSLVAYDPVQGLRNYEAAQAKGKGILYLTGHFSSWELLPVAHALHGYPLSFITRPLDNALLEKYLLKVRESKGNRVINKKNSARVILKNLSSGATAGILMDQNTSLQEGIFIDFFGIPAATTTSVALFALRTDAPVLPGYLTPMRDGRYTIKFLPPIEVIRTGDMNRDLEVNTRQFNAVLEGIVREQPEAWLWGHRRWKHQPSGHPPDLYSLSAEQLSDFLAKARRRSNDAKGLTGPAH